MTPQRSADAVFAPIVGFLAVTPIAARALSLDIGLLIGAAAAVALAYLARTRRAPRALDRPAPTRWHSLALTVAARPGTIVGSPLAGSRFASFMARALVLVVYGWMAIRTAFHDELIVFGHRSMTLQIARGVYPPFIPAFPGSNARYHVGFDLLSGALSRLTGLSASAAIDVVSILLVVLTWVVWTEIYRSVRDEPPSAFALLLPFLAGGLAWLATWPFLGAEPRCFSQIPRPACAEWILISPPISTWFQHPVSLGLPLALYAMLVSSRKTPFVLSVAAWSALAIGQIAYLALAASASVAAAIYLAFVSRRAAPLANVLVPLSLALVIARFQGGFFEVDPLYAAGLVQLRDTLGYPAGHNVVHVLAALTVSCGIGVLLLPAALWRAMRERHGVAIAMGAFAAAGLLIPQLFDYLRSPDINKFPQASAFVLPLIAVLEIEPRLSAKPRFALRFGLIAGGVVSAFFAMVPWIAGFKWAGPDKTPPLAGLVETTAWLRANTDARELVVTSPAFGTRLAIDSGQAVLVDDGHWSLLGLDPARTLARQTQLDRLRTDLDPATLAASGARWVIVPPGDAPGHLAERVAEEVLVPTATVSGVRVYRVSAGASGLGAGYLPRQGP